MASKHPGILGADALAPRHLFDGNVHYEIPPFQRPYVWNEEEQWAPLWADVARVAESVVESLETGATPAVPHHFLGAVVFESKPPSVGDVSRFPVIDGQQRTTTLQILLDAVQQVLQERGHEDLAEDLESLILNKSSKFKNRPERFKLWPSRHDREGFSQAMDPQSGWSGDHRIVGAHDFFRAEAHSWLEGAPDPDGDSPPGTEEARAEALTSTVMDRLVVVAINLTYGDDSQLIFETLNDRGTPLLKADLVKNWVFKRGEVVGADIDLWPETHWADFDEDWWREEISQGRHNRSRIDIFLQYWLTMRLREEVKTEQVFRSFTDYAAPLMADATGAEELLAALRRDADTFRGFAEFGEDTPEGSFYSHVIEAMELAATSPVFMWLLSENHGVPPVQRDLALESLESWVIRRTLLKLTMKDVNKLMVTMLRALDVVEPTVAGEAVREFLAVQTADSRYWPSDEKFVAELPGQKLYSYIRQSRLRLVLEAVEKKVRSESAKSEQFAITSKLEIEHVMPQGWRSHWNNPSMSTDQQSKRDAAVNTIGNLTLIAKRLNGSLSNRPWTDAAAIDLKEGGEAGLGKRSLLQKHSLLALSRELVNDHPESWTESDIAERGRRLAERICSIWHGPPADIQTAAMEAASNDEVVATAHEELPAIEWTPEDLIAFASGSGPFMLAVLDRLASRPGELLVLEDFDDLGFSTPQIRGTLGAISTSTYRKFMRRNAPLEYAQTDGRWHYMMTPDVASVWDEVRRGS